jgi:iron complex outermembrane recepter protein
MTYRLAIALVVSVGFEACFIGAATADELPNPTADQDATKLEEIVVTSQKRVENLQDVPASVEALSGDLLQRTNVDSVQDLSRSVPGLALGGERALYSTIFIRGIGTQTDGYSVEPSVGTVLDGVVIGRSGASVLDFYDIDRLEVLRGPQGTLFGKNTSAGAINVVTRNPTSDLDGYVGASYGSYQEVKVDGALSGPLINNLLEGRVAFLVDSHDGYIHNIFDGRDLDDSHQYAFRGKLLFTPHEGTRIMLSGDYADMHSSCCALPVREITPASNFAEKGLIPGFAGFPPGFISKTNAQVDIAIDDAVTNNRSKGVSLQWDQAIGDFTLTSITAYRDWDAFQNQVGQNTTPISLADSFFSTVTQHQTSQELRIASPTGPGHFVDYVAGLYFYTDSITDKEDWVLDLGPVFGAAPGAIVSPVKYSSVTAALNYAAFGEANIHVTDDISLIAGLRETHERVDFHQIGNYLFGAPLGAIDSDGVNNLSWRFGARWKISSDNMVYATVSRGFKGPGFNGNSTILGQAQKVDPEVATSYELGWKAEFLDDRMRANVAAFRTYLDKFQVQGYIVTGTSSLATQFLINAGQIRTQGVELDLDSTPFKGFSINFNGAYIDAKYTDFRNAPCYSGQTIAGGCSAEGFQNLNGVVTPNTPKFSFDINANYEVILPSVPFNAFVRADYAWKDKVQWDATNNPNDVEGAYGVLGGGFGFMSKDRRYSVTAYGRNLTNKFHTGGINSGATPESILLPDYRRTWGVRFDARL